MRTRKSTNVSTYGYINVDPNPIGVGQTVTIDFFLGVPLINSGYPVGFMIYVGLPDGTTTTLGPFIGDETGGSHTTYTPMTPGTYTFYMKYPGQTLHHTCGSVKLLRRTLHESHCNAYGDEYACNPRAIYSASNYILADSS